MGHPTELHFVTCEFKTPGSWMAGYHTGRDYRARTPLPVFATRAGTVLHADWGGWGPAYGIQVIIETDGIKHMYAHLSAVTCSAGQRVAEGEQIALSGNTGTRASHLHYEERVSPYRYANHREPIFDRSEATDTVGFSKPSKPLRVDIGKVVEAFLVDPVRTQGDGRYPRHIRPVEKALMALGLLDTTWAMDGYAGTATRDAYRAWQESLGFSGDDADGLPGTSSLRQLGALFGFKVTGRVPDATPVVEPGTANRGASSAGALWAPMATRDVIEGQSDVAPWNTGTANWKGLLHTTEGPSYEAARAAYTDGGVPHFTVAPDFLRRRVEVFQHFPISSRATALRDNDATLKENRAHVIQIEIVGTCDHRARDSFPAGLFIADWPPWYARGIGRLMRWLEENHGIAQTSTVDWKSFDSGSASGSFGASNGVRLTNAQYLDYTGWLGHQHVPENDHGDPGDIDINALLAVRPRKRRSLTPASPTQ